MHRVADGVCSDCGPEYRRAADGRCLDGQAARQRARWAAMTPDERWRRRRDHGLRFKYGITLAQYEAMAEAQGGVCAICGQAPQEHRRHLDVDHDHETGEVRGLLCSPCNRAIGYLRDRPELARAAAAYLESR